MSMDVVLQQITKLDPVHLFKEGADTVLKDIAQFARSVDFDPATPEGRELGKSIAYKCARAKTMIDDMGKTLVAEIKKQSGAIDAERKKVRDTLDALRDEIKKPIEEWERSDFDRKDRIEVALRELSALGDLPFDATVEVIDERIATLEAPQTISFDEYSMHRDQVGLAISQRLFEARTAAVKRQDEQAELETLRAGQRKRDEEAAEADLERERENRAAEQAFTTLYTKAHAENMAYDAAFKAVEEERKRIAAEREAERLAETKREENKRHRAKIHNAIVADLVQNAVLTEELAKSVVIAIAAGKITRTKITY